MLKTTVTVLYWLKFEIQPENVHSNYEILIANIYSVKSEYTV